MTAAESEALPAGRELDERVAFRRLVRFLQSKADELGRGPYSEGPCHCVVHEGLDIANGNAMAHENCGSCEVAAALKVAALEETR